MGKEPRIPSKKITQAPGPGKYYSELAFNYKF